MGGQEERQHISGKEQYRDQRDAAPELDENDGGSADDRQLGAAPKREQDAERQREDDAGERNDESHQEPAPQAGLHMRQPEHVADQQEESDDRKDPEKQDRIESLMGHTRNEQRNEQDSAERVGQVDPPLFACRIEAVHELGELGPDERPASADLAADRLRQTIDAARARPDRVDKQKLHGWPQHGGHDDAADDGQDGIEHTIE